MAQTTKEPATNLKLLPYFSYMYVARPMYPRILSRKKERNETKTQSSKLASLIILTLLPADLFKELSPFLGSLHGDGLHSSLKIKKIESEPR